MHICIYTCLHAYIHIYIHTCKGTFAMSIERHFMEPIHPVVRKHKILLDMRFHPPEAILIWQATVHLCMYVCMYACMYMHPARYAPASTRGHPDLAGHCTSLHVCMCVCMYACNQCVCVYVCLFVCMYISASCRTSSSACASIHQTPS
jgi:hypothetical protein